MSETPQENDEPVTETPVPGVNVPDQATIDNDAGDGEGLDDIEGETGDGGTH
jgi:hypothetical protein